MDHLLAWRKEFPILEKSVYMINNSLGAMPRSVHNSLSEYADVWATRGIRAWEEGWWEMPVAIGDLIGKIIGAGAGEVSMHQNVTIAEAIVFSSLSVSPTRNRIVYSELNFPSVRYFYQAQQDVEVQVVPCPDGVTVPLDDMLAAIDERTLVVPISHVIFKSSFIQDAASIIKKAHSVGALVILDTYQSCGAVPFNVKELDVDFVIGGSVKWLCGGPGVAYLYVRPDLRDRLEPRLTGWMAHEHPFDFAPRMEYTRSAFRFLNGTPNIPGLYAARCGYEIIAAVGVEHIRQKSLQMTERIFDLADEFQFPVNTPRFAEERGGHVTVNPPEARRVCDELLQRNFIVDYRPGAGIRVAPHFYNTMDEVEHLMAEMKAIVYTGARR
ncbi:MAG TPA: aminotransferase class V-fold PLP-dependent enzyme [Acidobacteriota bacterium]|jgi:kynureninase|nr:aminotransferase class V-fold PLP-dependent enzyme [Acidobacteriota bacterium]